MEPHRRPSGRRLLLPAEVELCEAVGLSEDEYWYFVEAAELDVEGRHRDATSDGARMLEDATIALPAAAERR